MPETPQAATLPDRPALHLSSGNLAISSPYDIAETTFSIPAIRALRNAHPNSNLLIISPQHIAPIWRQVPEINQILEVSPSDSPSKVASLLKKTNLSFDAAIAWEDNAASRAFKKLSISQRFGPSSEPKLTKFLTKHIDISTTPGPIKHRVQDYLLFVQELGADPFQPQNFSGPTRSPLSPDAPLTLIPGSDYGPAAEYPIDQFTSLASHLSQNHSITIIPTPNRPQPATQLAKNLPQANLPNNPTTDQVLELLTKSKAVIASDGSLPHIASFVNTPSAIFFGPNEPQWKRPLGKQHLILHEHVPCSACLLNKCPLDHRCLINLSPENAINQILNWLNS